MEIASTEPTRTAGTRTTGTRTGPTGEGELAARLRLAVLRLSRQLRQQLVGGVTQSQVSVLSSVERLGTPTLGELAASEKVQPPSMTRQVDALVAAGLLARQVHPVDRRIVQVRLTAGGERTLHQNRSVRTAFVASRLKRLPADERARLGELVGLLEKLVDEK
jgi:DNA-binding MarR family transcriptional regulator